jgi:hypothetical protein
MRIWTSVLRTPGGAAAREVLTVVGLATAGLVVVAVATLGPYAWDHHPLAPGVTATTSTHPLP